VVVVVVVGVKVVMVGVVVVEVDLIDNHICFGTYHRLNFAHILIDNLISWTIRFKGRFYSADVSCNNA